MAYHESSVPVVVKGLVAGLAGTGALTVATRRAPVLMDRLGLVLPDGRAAAAAQGIHWGYGVAWGIVYGLVQEMFRWPTLVQGTFLGGLVAVVASTVLPAAGLGPPPTRQPLSTNVMQLGLHLLYGWVTALTFRLLHRG